MKIHHILADGREVDSIDGYEVNIKDYPELQRLFINANRNIENVENTEEKIGA